MRGLLLTMLCCTAVCACMQDFAAPKEAPGEAPEPVPSVVAPGITPHVLDIGDVESELRVFANVADRARGAALQIEEQQDYRKNLTLVNVAVTPPVPAVLPLKIWIKAKKAFKDQPVVVRGRILRDGQAIDSFATVVGQYAVTSPAQVAVAAPVLEFETDALAGLAEMPETMLIHVEAECHLMSAGTSQAVLDPSVASADDKNRTTILSNAVRIDLGLVEASS